MENLRNILKQIAALNLFENSRDIATYLTLKNPNISSLSTEHIETLKWIKEFIKPSEYDASLIADAALIGLKNIKNAINEIAKVLEIEIEEVYSKIRKTPNIILISSKHINDVYNYLSSIKLSAEQIKTVFSNAILLGTETLKKRCELCLKYWTVDDLISLKKCCFFDTLYYSDPIEAITVAVDTLGSAKALEFFHSYPNFFLEYRAEENRCYPSDFFLYQTAVKALNEYSQNN